MEQVRAADLPGRAANSFDALRLLFALLVIVAHSYALLRLPDPLQLLTGAAYDLGKLGVTGFFAISGYLITQSWLRTPHPLRFVLARVLRIFPAFCVALVFSVLVAALVTPNATEFLTSSTTWRWVWKNALAVWNDFGTQLPGAFEGNPFPSGANGSLWTLTYELRCYAAVLVLGLTGLLSHRRSLYVVVAILVFYYFKAVMDPALAGRPMYYDMYLAFATGLLVAGAGYRPALWLVSIIAMISLVASVAGMPGSHLSYAPAQSAIALAVVRLANSGALKRLSFPTGDYSYGVYVYAFPLQQLAIALLGSEASPFLILVITVAAVLPVAVLSWHVLEIRALQWLRASVRAPMPGSSVVFRFYVETALERPRRTQLRHDQPHIAYGLLTCRVRSMSARFETGLVELIEREYAPVRPRRNHAVRFQRRSPALVRPGLQRSVMGTV